METRHYGYCDLSISRNFKKLHLIEKVEKLGYNTIALNTHVPEASEEPKKKKKKRGARDKQDFFPAPFELWKDIKDNLKMNILQRVTIEFSDSSIAHKINQSENLKKFDIIAVLPKTLEAFHYACGTMDVDIVTFEPESRIPFKVTRKWYKVAVDRGIFFELMYSAAIKDFTIRKNIFSTSHNYHAVGKSKNLILTSGAKHHTQVRGVYDVKNLGFLLGLNSKQSLEVIRSNPTRLILKAEGRRSGKLFVKLRTETENNDNETL